MITFTDICTRKQTQEERIHGPIREKSRNISVRELRLQEEGGVPGADERESTEPASGSAGAGDPGRQEVTAARPPLTRIGT